MNKDLLENLLKEIKSKHELYYLDVNKISKSYLLNKQIKFNVPVVVDDVIKENVKTGIVEEVTVTTDCDVMLEVKDTNTKESFIIFSYNIIETE
jgi:polysaccharide deacetylase 2 family uncharacterized protein YibQ